MNRHLRVYLIPYEKLGAVLRGESRVLNWPADGQALGHHDCESLPGRTGVAVLATSAKFEIVPHGMRVPVVTAVFAKTEEPACT